MSESKRVTREGLRAILSDFDREPPEDYLSRIFDALPDPPSADVDAAWVTRLSRLLHESRKHKGGMDSLCLSAARGFAQEVRAEGLDALTNASRAMWYAHTEDERFTGPVSDDPYGDFERALIACLTEAGGRRLLGGTSGTNPPPPPSPDQG